MVTDDELEGIRRLRGAGKTHQEIADQLGLKRSTVAYQLQKVKSSDEDSSINMIHASEFKPQETLISFDNHSFESHRVKSTLYTTGRSIYEMRGGVIHSTNIREPFLGGDYPRLVPIIRDHGRNWYADVTRFASAYSKISKDFFVLDKALRSVWEALGLSYQKFEEMLPSIYMEAYRKACKGLPKIPGMVDPTTTEVSIKVIKGPMQLRRTSYGNQNQERIGGLTKTIKEYEGWEVDLLHFIHSNHPEFINHHRAFEQSLFEQFSKPLQSIRRRIGFDDLISGTGYSHYQRKIQGVNGNPKVLIEEKLAKKIPKLIADYYKESGFAKEDILFIRKNNIGLPEVLEHFRESGVEEFGQYREMMQFSRFVEFESYEQYQQCKSLVSVLRPVTYPDNLTELYRHGILIDAHNTLLIHPDWLFLAKLHKNWPNWTEYSLNLKSILGGVAGLNERYVRNQEFFHATGLSPNHTNYKWVDKQSDSQLKSLKRFPSPRAATVYDTISTSPTQSLMLDSLIRIHNESKNPGPTIQDQRSMHAILSKKPFTDICVSSLESGFVERYQNGKPLLDISKFKDLNGKDSSLNKKVISAITRNAADDSLTTAWTRFEASSKELWARDLEEPLPTNGQVAVRMVDEMAKLVKFTPAMTKGLHLARQLRNDVIHGEDPREEIKPKHIRRVLEATEKIIKMLN
jgi:hypothetical protein